MNNQIYQSIDFSVSGSSTTHYIGNSYYDAINAVLSSNVQKIVKKGYYRGNSEFDYVEPVYGEIDYPTVDSLHTNLAVIIWKNGKAVKQKIVQNHDGNLTGIDSIGLQNIFDKTTWKRV